MTLLLLFSICPEDFFFCCLPHSPTGRKGRTDQSAIFTKRIAEFEICTNSHPLLLVTKNTFLSEFFPDCWHKCCCLFCLQLSPVCQSFLNREMHRLCLIYIFDIKHKTFVIIFIMLLYFTAEPSRVPVCPFQVFLSPKDIYKYADISKKVRRLTTIF